MLYDADNNGCDATDANPYLRINVNDGTTQGAAFTDSSGNYTFYTGTGNFTLTPDFENAEFFTVNPANAVVNFPLENSSVATQNLCITANGVHPDLEIVVAPTVPARPGFDAVYKITYKNKGNQVLSQPYGVSLFTDQNLMTYVSADITPETIGSGRLRGVMKTCFRLNPDVFTLLFTSTRQQI
ncbi:hypothetical protein [Flavobacterium sp. 3HN19-14]|uniref:hypothetical protein n=1 Tax=Flavobacterium sp. 3HN19-14 TaxID=3448133 RepID=UPI003EE393F4